MNKLMKTTALVLIMMMAQFLLPLDALAMQDDPAEKELTEEVLPDDPALTDPALGELPHTVRVLLYW